MEKRILGRTNLAISVLGFGAAELGLQNVDLKSAEILLNAALDSGLNVIDTAECYGRSEELIGLSIGRRRKDFFVFTKCGHADDPEQHWQPQTIRDGIERSLRRLRTDCVDLLQLHSCPLDRLRGGEIIDLLEALKQEGKTRFIGCSADGGAAEFAISTGRFDTLQTSFNLVDQEFIDRNLVPAKAQNMGLIIKRPIANAVWRHENRPENPWLHAYWDRLSELKYTFLASERTKVAEIALRFVLTPDAVSTVIVGTVNPAHLRENIGFARAGALDSVVFDAIRRRWRECDRGRWLGKG